MRVTRLALKGGDAASVAASARDDPDVIGVGEGDVRGTDRGRTEQTGAGVIGRRGKAKNAGNSEKNEQQGQVTQKIFGHS